MLTLHVDPHEASQLQSLVTSLSKPRPLSSQPGIRTQRDVLRSQAISALRAKASHAADDIGIVDSAGKVHITNADQYSIAVARTPAQVPLV